MMRRDELVLPSLCTYVPVPLPRWERVRPNDRITYIMLISYVR
jgi:hypothetical protein